jgi:hypothetical protein
MVCVWWLVGGIKNGSTEQRLCKQWWPQVTAAMMMTFVTTAGNAVMQRACLEVAYPSAQQAAVAVLCG